MRRIYIILLLMLACRPTVLLAENETSYLPSITIGQRGVAKQGRTVELKMSVDLSNARIRTQHTVALTPVLVSADGNREIAFPPIVIDGKTRHKVYLRAQRLESVELPPYHNDSAQVIIRHSSKNQQYDYVATVPYQRWMLDGRVEIADTSLISRPEITEQAFVDFISVLPYSSKAQTAVDTLFCRVLATNEMLYHFIALTDKYLYEPNSPMHNEELHILFLRALVSNPDLGELDKIRPRHQLEMAMKNRPGDVSADFTVVCRDGKQRRLSDIKADYVLIYFNDPDCEDCRRVKEELSRSTVVNRLLESGRLKLLSVCVEGKIPGWEKAGFPTAWIDGYDAGQRLTREQIYDLKAMPTLYLLDAEKRVILKDASFGQVEERLR